MKAAIVEENWTVVEIEAVKALCFNEFHRFQQGSESGSGPGDRTFKSFLSTIFARSG